MKMKENQSEDRNIYINIMYMNYGNRIHIAPSVNPIIHIFKPHIFEILIGINVYVDLGACN